jgi:hypothetical protein
MRSPESEPAPQELTPVQRFYNTVKYKTGSYVDLLINVDDYLTTEGIMVDVVRPDTVEAALPTEEMFNLNSRIAIEQFMLLPLKLVAPVIEVTGTTDKIGDWYSYVAKWIQRETKNIHQQSCLDTDHAGSVRCGSSGECPLVVLKNQLNHGVRYPEFRSYDYMVDPEQARHVAVDKARLAARLGLVEVVYSEAQISAFKRRYEEFFPFVEQIQSQDSDS